MNKDQSIITQVAAKIAADLTPPHDDVNTRIASWLDAFDAVREALFNAHGDSINTSAPQATSTTSTAQMTEQTMIQQAFPTAQPMSHEVRVKGTQHGPLPEWLIVACKRDNVSEVWDNRDSIAANPKRPWFKATSGDKAYWQPRN
jgi:hypothetical protein